MGYHQAGFEVVGVDCAPQPHYPFTFHQADALTYPLDGFDAVHASPPCYLYSPVAQQVADRFADYLVETRTRLETSGIPFIIENVPQAPLRHDVVLCGQQFNLPLYRHRAFEASFELLRPKPCHHVPARSHVRGWRTLDQGVITVAGHAFRLNEGRLAMEMPWATSRKELVAAIPPAYTEYLGDQLREVV